MQKRIPKVYLSGPIEFAKDGGVGWREVASKFLRSKGFEVFNPIESSIQLLNSHSISSVQEYNDLKKAATSDLSSRNKYIQATRSFIDFDLKELKSSDLVLAILDKTVSGGTSGELTISRDLGIPVIALAQEEDFLSMSAWTFSCANEIFWIKEENFSEELSDILEDICEYLNVIAESESMETL